MTPFVKSEPDIQTLNEGKKFEPASHTMRFEGAPELIHALYLAVPGAFFPDSDHDLDPVEFVFWYNDSLDNPEQVAEWFERALMGIQTKAAVRGGNDNV